jgi:hypothetical protein
MQFNTEERIDIAVQNKAKELHRVQKENKEMSKQMEEVSLKLS